MHLLFDGQSLQSPSSRGRGIGRYAFNLLNGIRQVRPDWRITFVENGHCPPADRAALPGDLELLRYDTPLPHGWADAPSRWVNDRCYGDWVLGLGADALLTVSVFELDSVQPIFGDRRMPHFVVIHDLIPLIFAEDGFAHPAVIRGYTERLHLMCEADMLLANSRCTARDYRRLMTEGRGAEAEVTTIGGSTDPSFRPLDGASLARLEPAIRGKFDLPGEFILDGGGDCWRKNMRGALEAFAMLPESYRGEFKFVVACRISASEQGELRALADRLGVGDALRITGFVSDDELRALYSLCRVFMFPSLYEGLGLPIVEALRCGAPVVTSDTSSMPEYAGDVSHLCDPLRVESVSAALRDALDEPRQARRDQRVAFAERFCWNQSAAAACDSIELVVAKRRLRPRDRRPRLAWVCPISQHRCDFTTYATELAGLLSQDYSIELVVGDDQPAIPTELGWAFSVISAGELEQRHRNRPYDLFVYHLADDPRCAFMAPLMDRHPGVVVLNDSRLGKVFRGAVTAGLYPGSRDRNTGDGPDRLRIAGHRVWGTMRDNRRLLREAKWVAAHSEDTVRDLRGQIAAPVALIRPGVRPADCDAELEREDLGFPEDWRFVVGVEAGRSIRTVLSAAAELPERLRDKCGVTVLNADPEQRYECLRAASDAGLDGRVIFPGSPGTRNLPVYVGAVDVFVHLAERVDSPLPRTLLYAMAAGRACLVHGGAAMTDLPDRSVYKLPGGKAAVRVLSRALVELAGDPERREEYGRAARHHLLDHHDIREAARRLNGLLTAVMRGPAEEAGELKFSA